MSWTLEFDCSRAMNGGRWPPGPNDRLHWRVRAAQTREWRQRVYVACKNAGIPDLTRVRVSIEYVSTRGPLSDHDNLIARSKALYDGLQGSTVGHASSFLPGIIPDDSPAHLELGPVTETRGKIKLIRMTIEAVP